MSKRRLWWLLGVASVAPFATAAHAQSLGKVSGAGKAAAHIGGHSASALDEAIPVGFTARAEAVYDTNVARSRTSFGPNPIIPKDEIFRPSLLANVNKTFGRLSLFLNGTAGWDIYRQNTFLNHENIDGEAGGEYPLGPCKMQLSGSFQRHQSDLADVTTIISNVENHETGSLQADCSQLVGVAPEGTVSYGGVQNSDPKRVSVDRNVLSAEGGVGYTRPAFGQITLFGQYEDAKFPNLIANIGGVQVHDAYSSWGGGLRYTRKLGARIEGEFELSYDDLKPSLPGASGFQGITYSVDLTYKPTGKVDSHFVFSRKNNPSNRLGSTFSTDDVYSGDVSYQFGARLKLDVGGEYRRRQFGDVNIFIGHDLNLEKIKHGQAQVTYDMSKRLEWSLRYEYENRHADVTKFNYTSNRVTLHLDVKL